jgi:hypothetical protein
MKQIIKKVLVSFLLFSTLLTSASTFYAPPIQAAGVEAVKDLCDAFGNVNFLNALFVGAGAAAIASGFADRIAGEREWYDQSPCQFYLKVFDDNNENEIFGERYTYAQITWIIDSLGSYLMNTVFGFGTASLCSPFVAAGIDCPFTADAHSPNLASTSKPTSFMGVMGDTMLFMKSNQPSFFHHTLPDFLDKFKLASPASAQGYGYTALSAGGARSLQSLWAAFRNMSLFLMVLLLVVSGFMVMFRVRMGQTAVTLQLMIPNIIMTLIGILFSFAIAGFVIDLVYLTLGFILYLIASAPGNFITDGAAAVRYFTDPNIGFYQLWGFFNAFSTPATLVLGFLIPGFGFIIFPILFIILLFKVWWAMLKTYANLIIHIITGPFQILLGLVPGQNMGFGQWFRNIVGYSAVFVAVPLVFLLIIILWSGGLLGSIARFVATISPSITNPPVNGLEPTSLPNMPLFGTLGLLGGAVLQYGLGWILVALMPSIMDKVPAAFKAISLGKADITGELQTAFLGGLSRARSGRDAASRAIGMPIPSGPEMVAGAGRRAAGAVARRFGGGAGSSTASTVKTDEPI